MTVPRPGGDLERARSHDIRSAAGLVRVRREVSGERLSAAIGPLGGLFAILCTIEAAINAVDGDISAAVWKGLIATIMIVGVLWPRLSMRKLRRRMTQHLIDDVFELAQRRGGVLTVTAVAADPDLELTLDEAEQLLIALDDGSRVRSEISDEGVIYYEFTEFLDMEELRPGE